VPGRSREIGGPSPWRDLPVDKRLSQHNFIEFGERHRCLEVSPQPKHSTGLTPAVEIINHLSCWDGMKVVGELFGSGQMQFLPFVAAERWKTISGLVAFLGLIGGRRGRGERRASPIS